MCNQALTKPLPDMPNFKNQLDAWVEQRNNQASQINWQFTNDEARIKLKKLDTIVL